MQNGKKRVGWGVRPFVLVYVSFKRPTNLPCIRSRSDPIRFQTHKNRVLMAAAGNGTGAAIATKTNRLRWTKVSEPDDGPVKAVRWSSLCCIVSEYCLQPHHLTPHHTTYSIQYTVYSAVGGFNKHNLFFSQTAKQPSRSFNAAFMPESCCCCCSPTTTRPPPPPAADSASAPDLLPFAVFCLSWNCVFAWLLLS